MIVVGNRDRLSTALIRLIRGYQAASRLAPPCCRFQPSCSDYAAQAVAAHGAGPGSYLAFRRILRCHPFHAGGYDPVPQAPGMGHEETR